MAFSIATKKRADERDLQLGNVGKRILADTTAVTGANIGIIHALTDVVINTMTDETIDGGSMAGVTLSKGDRYYGVITAITLTSGTAILYYR